MPASRLLASICLAASLCACGGNSPDPLPRGDYYADEAARASHDGGFDAQSDEGYSTSSEDLAEYARNAAAFNKDPEQYHRDAAVRASLAQRPGQTSAKRPGDMVPARAGDSFSPEPQLLNSVVEETPDSNSVKSNADHPLDHGQAESAPAEPPQEL